MKVTTTRHVTHTLQLDNDTPLELVFEPIDSTILTERKGDKIVVGYLVQDEGYGSDPMEDHDGNGKLIIGENRNGAEHRIQYSLGLDSNGYVDIEREFQVGSDTVTLLSLAQDSIEHQHSDDPERDAETLSELLYKDHFDQIARWAVPVDYRDFGSSGTQIRISDWKGDTSNVPNAVWLADDDARANLEFDGKVPTRAEVEEYCKGVLEEYEKWCNGEVYGVVVETFEENNGYWTKTDNRDNECWGHIGYGYAKEALAEAMQ